MPILEAIACGCPVVAFSLSSLPEAGGEAVHYALTQTGESYASALNELNSATVQCASLRDVKDRAALFDWLQTF